MKICSCGTVMKKGMHFEGDRAKFYYVCPKCKNRIYKRKMLNFKEVLRYKKNRRNGLKEC